MLLSDQQYLADFSFDNNNSIVLMEYLELKKNCGRCLYFSLSTHKQCILSHFIHHSAAMFPKNLIPSWDSNPGLLVPEADAMSTPPRRQGYIWKFFISM
jgi:hypothetical protein